MTELDLQWRAMRPEDRNYVLSSWLRSYAEGPEFRHMARSVYFGLYEPVVQRLLDRSTVAIASTADLPDSVLGYLVVEGDDVVHYVLVKPRWRRLGVARWLTKDLRDLPAVYTHTRNTEGWKHIIGASWTYDPSRRFERKAAA